MPDIAEVKQESLANTKVSAWQQCACTKAPSEEMYGKSAQRTQCWKVHSVGFNAVANNTGLFSFI